MSSHRRGQQPWAGAQAHKNAKMTLSETTAAGWSSAHADAAMRHFGACNVHADSNRQPICQCVSIEQSGEACTPSGSSSHQNDLAQTTQPNCRARMPSFSTPEWYVLRDRLKLYLEASMASFYGELLRALTADLGSSIPYRSGQREQCARAAAAASAACKGGTARPLPLSCGGGCCQCRRRRRWSISYTVPRLFLLPL